MKNIIVILIAILIVLLLFNFARNNYKITYEDDGCSYDITFGRFASNEEFLIKIKNNSSRIINFTLGFNDMLFPEKNSVIQYIKYGDVGYGLTPLVAEQYKEKLRNADNSKDYFRAFLFLLSRTFHHIELTDQYDFARWAQSPMLVLNSFGFGTCGTHSSILCMIWQELNYSVRLRPLNGHVVSEVFDGKRWVIFDLDKGVYYFDENFELVGIDELKRNPKLIFSDMRLVVYNRPEYEYPQSDAGPAVADIIVKSEDSYLKPRDTLPSETDWIPLNVTLPSKATFSFPFQGEDIFFAGHIDLVPEYGEKVLTPKHKYAVLEVDKGTTGEINVGLYPFKIEGDCTLSINDPKERIEGREFDQVNKYRSERIFARTITLVETKSPVRIYYLLNNNTRLLKSNRLILGKGGAKELEVRLSKKKTMKPYLAEKGKIDLKKKMTDLVEIIPKSVFIASNSYNRTYLPQYLIDGKVSTSWISDLVSDPQPIEIVFDLGEPCLLAKIEWLASLEYPFVTPSEFVVALSQEGKKYAEIVKKSDPVNKKMIWHEIDVGQHLTRYVKIIVIPVPHPNLGFFQAGLGEVKFLVKHNDQN